MQQNNKIDWRNISGDYHYHALHFGGRLKRFWHMQKIELIRDVLQPDKEDIILDLGCGSGNNLFALNKECKMICGAEINNSFISFIEEMKIRKGLNNIESLKINGDLLPFEDNSFDKIIFSEVIEHIKKPEKILSECYRVLKPNGSMLITTPDYKSLWVIAEYLNDLFDITPKIKDAQHVFIFDRRTLRNFLENHDFKIIRYGSFFMLSPLVSLISFRLAKKVFKHEIKPNRMGSTILYALIKKQRTKGEKYGRKK